MHWGGVPIKEIFYLPAFKMKFKLRTLLFLLSLFIIPSALAANEAINSQYPSDVNSFEPFSASVELINFSQGIYDVKIDILNTIINYKI